MLAVVMSVIGTMIVPRDTPARIAGSAGLLVHLIFRTIVRPFRRFETKDRILAFEAPFQLLAMLALWVNLLLVGFALIDMPVTHHRYASALREIGSSMFTLGFATTPGGGATAIDLLAAASGLSVVALLIGYLPVLYGAFNRRENLVTMLEARAGKPAWGPEILWRHQRIGILDSLPAFYEEWERWCADVAESHSTYWVLLFFRSPDPLRSWLTGLLAVLDSAALYLSLAPDSAPSQARLCLRMGFTGLRTLADTLYIRYDEDPLPDAPIELTYEDYLRGVQRLQQIGFPMERSPEQAWPDFRGWRVNYEGIAIELARRIISVPGPWATARDMPAGELIATKRPVDRTPDQPEGTEFTRPGTYEPS